VFFNSIDTGYIGTDSGKVYKTLNGGVNWISINLSTTKPIGKIIFVSPNIGYLLCYNSNGQDVIFKSTNGGLNWSMISIPYYTYPEDIYFINLNTGYVANFTNVLRTSNGGMSWDTLRAEFPSTGTIQYYGVFFKNSQTGYVVGGHQYPNVFNNRVIWQTVNGGQNWSRVNTLSGCEYLRISFLNEVTGYSVGGCNFISKTTNGGSTWNAVNLNLSGSYANLGSLQIINSNKVFTCGRWGLYNTNNGGTNWSLIQIPYESYREISFPGDSIGYVVGEFGRIFKTTNGGTALYISTISSQIPQSFSLHQNYPNPFNPVTKIQFQIPLLRGVSEGRGVFTKILIYDLLGREVTTLVSEQLKPGTYEVEWDGTGFASGVYFYSLITSDYVETKRMVLVK